MKEEIPAYLENLVKAVMELHKFTEELKSKSVITLKTGRGRKKTEAISGKWLLRKTGTYEEIRTIRKDCRVLSSKIRGWLGYYDEF